MFPTISIRTTFSKLGKMRVTGNFSDYGALNNIINELIAVIWAITALSTISATLAFSEIQENQ